MESKKTVEIIKWDHGELRKLSEPVIVEEALEILVNDRHFVYLMCTPDEMDELAVGYLFAEGVIDSSEDIASINHPDWNKICIYLKQECKIDTDQEKSGAITSGCGKGKIRLVPVDEIKRIEGGPNFKPQELIAWMHEFGQRSDLFKETGGVHSCGIVSCGELLFFSEDIGRHNALDKVIGKTILKQLAFRDVVLLTTGRISSDIALKAARAGIPFIVSFSAPTYMALEIAGRANLTLIGFVRGNRMNVYNGAQRINFDTER